MKVSPLSEHLGHLYPLSNKIGWLSCLGLTFWLGIAPARTANGQMFVEDWGYRTIREYTTSGVVVRSPLVTFPSGPAGPVGLSLDRAGNIFCGDGNAGVVRKYTTTGATVNNLFITGLGRPYSVLCDGNGRLFVADALNCRVGVYDTTTGAALNASLIQWTASPTAMTLDGLGNLFVAFADNTIREYDAATGAPLVSPLISGLNSPRGMAYGGNGHLFVGSWDSGTVAEYTTTGETINAALISGLVNVTDLTFDASGNLFVADWKTGRISEYTSTGQVINPNVLTLSSHISSVVIVVPEPSVMTLALLAGVLLLAWTFHARVAADVSRRQLRCEKNAPTDVGGYALSADRAKGEPFG